VVLSRIAITAGLSKHPPHPVNRLAGVREPPAEHRRHIHFRREQRNTDEQHEDVAEKNHDGGKQIALAGDVGLLRLERLRRERDVKGVGRANQQMKPGQEILPAPKP
jgi:hypothetical protein